MADQRHLAARNRVLLEQGLAVVRRLSDEQYRVATDRSQASIGAHVRHVCDFYSCLFSGMPERRIDYDARARDSSIEVRRERGLARIRELIGELERFDETAEPLLVSVDREAKGANEGWSLSSTARELQFLLSHTVHHFALIGRMLQDAGVAIPPDFGVAPSTIAYRRRVERRAR